MSRSNKNGSELLLGLLREAITKRRSGIASGFTLTHANTASLHVIEEETT
ncbi:hypothetical protein [Filibacter tadaridae]|nr:hypothetical protein [Filibacter tadaridae]